MLLIHLVKDSQCCGANREVLVTIDGGTYQPDIGRYLKDGYSINGEYEVRQLSGAIALPYECHVVRLPEHKHKPVPNK